MRRVLIYGPTLMHKTSALKGAEILRARSAVGLLEMVHQYEPDLVIMDAQRRQVHGCDLLTILKEVAPGTRVLVVHDGDSDKLIAELQQAA